MESIFHLLIRLPTVPQGYPCDHLKWVMKDKEGQLVNLWGRACGAIIAVQMNHDTGQLSFRINGEVFEGLSGFPGAAPVRPYVRLWGSAGDSVCFTEVALRVSLDTTGTSTSCSTCTRPTPAPSTVP